MLKFRLAPVPDGDKSLPGFPDWMARLLRSRGIKTEAEAKAFLHPTWDQILPPDRLPGVREAAALLKDARSKGERAVVFGDYDADGVCASAIMMEALREYGICCDVYLPDRHGEGYGLNLEAIEKLAREYSLLLTVDCGITGIEEVNLARQKGMRVIVTDHHQVGETLPDAHAVISPLLNDYPFPYLCGAGVAWKLALMLLGDKAKKYLDLAALATVADMVSLTGENRAIVALGLPCIRNTRRPGLIRLMELSGISDPLTSEQVAFQLAPRLNACGRMASARIALELLTTDQIPRAAECALQAEKMNICRKDEEARVIAQAEEQVQKTDLMVNHALVVSGEEWNSGVVGLAAGRIAEKYAYPTVALAIQDGICVGSARSAGQVDIYRALKICEDLFLRFGGHRQAAGLTLEEKNLAEFRKRLSAAVFEQLGGRPPMPEMICDGEMKLADVTEENIALLSLMEPFGMGNPAPRFLCEGAQSLSLRPVGDNGRHLKCSFMQDGCIRDGIFFGGGESACAGSGVFRMAMTPVLNVFRGRKNPEMRLAALEILPEKIEKQKDREILSWLSDAKSETEIPLLSEKDLENLMEGCQGTLLFCRCLETALTMRRRFPQADFCLGGVRDARAYHTVLLYGKTDQVSAPFRNIVYCDGDQGLGLAGAKAFRLGETADFLRMAASSFANEDALRDCYRQLKKETPRSLEDFALQVRLTRGQAAFALSVLSEIQLIEYSVLPFRVTLLPMRKIGPRDSRLFQNVVRLAGREKDGIFGL